VVSGAAPAVSACADARTHGDIMPKANGHYQDFVPSDETIAVMDETHRRASAAMQRTSSPRIIETDFALLPDSRILDLVNAGTTSLSQDLSWVVWRNGEFIQAKEIECNGAMYIPPQLPKGLEGAAQLPTAIGPLVTARELVEDIETRARTFLGIPAGDAILIALFALSTFFFDRLGFAPYLTVCGPPGSGKSTLLRFLRCVTRRGLHVGGITPASLYRLTDMLSPTLLIDEADFGNDKSSREYLRLLRNGNRPGADIYIGARRYRTFCPKVICSRVPVNDAALASRAVHIAMLPMVEGLQTLDEKTANMVSRELQPTLERFRLEHYHNVRLAGDLDMAGLSPRMRDLTWNLGAPIAAEPDLLDRLLICMREQDRDSQVDKYAEPEWAVATALFEFAHRPGDQVFIGNLTMEVGRILGELCEKPLSAHMVGRIARKSLGAETQKVGRGYYLQLTRERRRQIHQLARNMGLTKADITANQAVEAGYSGPPCRLCGEFGLNVCADGSALKSFTLPPDKTRAKLFDACDGTDAETEVL
jgi:hypothetical protein